MITLCVGIIFDRQRVNGTMQVNTEAYTHSQRPVTLVFLSGFYEDLIK
jgi:hypothetical protein